MSQSGSINVENSNPHIATSFITNSGTAVPSLNKINILGIDGISTSGSGDTVTISLDGSGEVLSVTATAPLTANGESGVPQGGAVTLAISGSGFVNSVSGTSNRITASPTSGSVVIDIASTYVGQTSLTTLGTIATGVWNGTLLSGQYGGTGVANTGLTITLASGASGKYLASDSSGNGTWAALSGVAVTTLTGTANEVLVNATSGSATSGAITLTTPQPIGTTSSVQFSSLILSATTAQYNLAILGATTGNSSQYGAYIGPTITPNVTGGSGQVLYVLPTFNIGTGLVETNASGLTIDTWTVSGSGSITNAYGAKIFAPTAGTSVNIALYTDNLSVGYANTPPTNGSLIKGKLGVGVSSIDADATIQFNSTGVYNLEITGTQTAVDSGYQAGLIFLNTLQPTNGSTVSAMIFSGNSIISPSGKTIATACSYYGSPNLISNVGTITSASTFYSDASASSGTVTYGYGLYAKKPLFGSTAAIAIYGDNGSIGYPLVNPPTNGLIVSGQVLMGASSDPVSQDYALEIFNPTNTHLLKITSSASQSSSSGASISIVQDDGTALTSGSRIGYLNFVGSKTATHSLAATASISAIAAENWSSTAYGGYLSFYTTATGGGSPSMLENMRVASNGGVAIGNSYVSTLPPSNGMIVSGNVGIGNNNPGAVLQVSGSTTNPYGILNSTTVTGQSGSLFSAGELINGLIASTSTGNFYSLCIIPDFGPPAGVTATVAAGLYIYPAVFAGTITSIYGLYVAQQAGGTNACAIYSDNMSIGYTDKTPPTHGLIVSGKLGVAYNAPTSLLHIGNGSNSIAYSVMEMSNDSSYQYWTDWRGNCTSSSGTAIGFNLGIKIAPTASVSSYPAANFSSYAQFDATSGSITNAVGIYCDVGSTPGGTITNGYGIYAKNPNYGTAKCALYSDNISIGYTGTTPPSNGLIVSGQVGIGTNSPNAASALEISSTTQGFRFPNMTTTQKNAISNVAGMVVFDTSLGKLCVNSGSAWQTITSV